jgi:hypothetical protein
MQLDTEFLPSYGVQWTGFTDFVNSLMEKSNVNKF